jgi:hypothetical protein
MSIATVSFTIKANPKIPPESTRRLLVRDPLHEVRSTAAEAYPSATAGNSSIAEVASSRKVGAQSKRAPSNSLVRMPSLLIESKTAVMRTIAKATLVRRPTSAEAPNNLNKVLSTRVCNGGWSFQMAVYKGVPCATMALFSSSYPSSPPMRTTLFRGKSATIERSSTAIINGGTHAWHFFCRSLAFTCSLGIVMHCIGSDVRELLAHVDMETTASRSWA